MRILHRPGNGDVCPGGWVCHAVRAPGPDVTPGPVGPGEPSGVRPAVDDGAAIWRIDDGPPRLKSPSAPSGEGADGPLITG